MPEFQFHDEAGFLWVAPCYMNAGDTVELQGALYQVKGAHWDNNGQRWRCCILLEHFGENTEGANRTD